MSKIIYNIIEKFEENSSNKNLVQLKKTSIECNFHFQYMFLSV